MDTHLELQSADHVKEMNNNGILVIRNQINEKHISAMTHDINIIREKIMKKINTMQRPIRTYSDIAERHLGRLDFRCGFHGKTFAEVEKPIVNLIRQFSPKITFKHYWGAIPSLGGSGPTDLHRDVYPFLNNMTGQNLDILDIQFPPYYFTVLIPLVPITPENGPTEFIKGSHQKPVIDEHAEKIFAPTLTPGDIVIFDGRTLHRGNANRTEKERLIAYITFVANWYNDQTFVMNDFLFPELIT